MSAEVNSIGVVSLHLFATDEQIDNLNLDVDLVTKPKSLLVDPDMRALIADLLTDVGRQIAGLQEEDIS